MSDDDRSLPVATSGATDFAALIERLATNPAVDVTKLAAILDLQERVMARQAEADFNAAFQRLSRDLPAIKKNGSVEYKGKEAFRFATWDSIDAIIRPLMEREEFTLSFDTVPRAGDGGGIIVTGTLSHLAGHRRTASIPVPLDMSGGKNSIQGYGSALSYGKRYTATALLNLLTVDDDDGVRGGMRFLEGEQILEIEALLEETQTSVDRFLVVMCGEDVRSLASVEAKDFTRLMNALKTKQQQRKTK